MAIPQDPKDIQPLKVGDKIPLISLVNDKNLVVNVNSHLKEKPAVLIFYRGGWCPYCNLQMSSLRLVEDEFYELGYNIFGISPDKPSNLAASRDKHNFRYQLLSDSKMLVTQAFELAYQLDDSTVTLMKEKFHSDLEADSGENHHLLPVPAVYLADAQGVFGFQHVNADFTVRMDSQELLRIARERVKAKKR